jgi:RNA polymerase sigma factor (sigma-70 family)
LKLFFSKDQSIINRIRLNDRTVLGDLYIKYRRMTTSYIISNGGTKEDVEDVLQETIIVLWRKVSSGKFDLTAKLSTYIMAIIRNKWMAIMRKRSRIKNTFESMEDQIAEPSSTLTQENDQRFELVREALTMIGELCRKLLYLFYYEGRNMKEIAGIMHFANENTAKSKKYQCKKKLELRVRNLLSKEGGAI